MAEVRGADDPYGLPLEEFVPARKALARQFRSDGDQETARRVEKLRRPSVAAWALNQAARRHPDLVTDLLGAGADTARAQRRGGDRLRDASRALGDTVARLAEAVSAEAAAAQRPTSAAVAEQVIPTAAADAARAAADGAAQALRRLEGR